MAAVTAYMKWLSSLVVQYEELAKSTVVHHGEKGRIVEGIVRTALRAVLPTRFNIGSGFVISASGATSRQLDLVVYDSLFNAPIVLEGGTGLFPVESVYGVVEVKSVLKGEDIDAITNAIGAVRTIAKEKVYVAYESAEVAPGKGVVDRVHKSSGLAPRSFIFAVRSELARETMLRKLKDATEQNNAHVHGLVVLESRIFVEQVAHRVPHEFVEHDAQDAFATFCAHMLVALQSMPVSEASMDRYYGIA